MLPHSARFDRRCPKLVGIAASSTIIQNGVDVAPWPNLPVIGQVRHRTCSGSISGHIGITRYLCPFGANSRIRPAIRSTGSGRDLASVSQRLFRSAGCVAQKYLCSSGFCRFQSVEMGVLIVNVGLERPCSRGVGSSGFLASSARRTPPCRAVPPQHPPTSGAPRGGAPGADRGVHQAGARAAGAADSQGDPQGRDAGR